jgi:hypothetical protein
MQARPCGVCAISPADSRVGTSILEGLDEMLTVNRLKLPRRWAVLAHRHQRIKKCWGRCVVATKHLVAG